MASPKRWTDSGQVASRPQAVVREGLLSGNSVRSYPSTMTTQRDPDWGRSKPRSHAAELLVSVGAIGVTIWAMAEAISYAHEIGHPPGIVGFLELFFRESIMLGLVTLGAVAAVVALIYRAMRRLYDKVRRTASTPANEA